MSTSPEIVYNGWFKREFAYPKEDRMDILTYYQNDVCYVHIERKWNINFIDDATYTGYIRTDFGGTYRSKDISLQNAKTYILSTWAMKWAEAQPFKFVHEKSL